MGFGALMMGLIGAASLTQAAVSASQKPSSPKPPKIELPETPIKEKIVDDQGFEMLMRRARGRRATIFTSPQLAETPPVVKRATLLSGV